MLRYNSNSMSEKPPDIVRRPTARPQVYPSNSIEDWDAIDEMDNVSNELSINFINKTHYKAL